MAPEGGRSAAAAGRVVIGPAQRTLNAIGDSTRLEAVVYDSEGREVEAADVRWRSLAETVASVDSRGWVVSRAAGLALIEASFDGDADTAEVVSRQVPASVSLRPDSSDLEPGAVLQLEAVVWDSNAVIVDEHLETWSSSAPEIGRVDDEGLVEALAEGSFSVTVDVSTARASRRFAVRRWSGRRSRGRGTVTRVRVSPPTDTLRAIGDTAELSVTAYDLGGREVSEPEVEWRSASPAVASVDASGRVVSRAVGVALIVASVGQVADTASVVSSQVAGRVEVSPASIELAVGDTFRLRGTVRDSNGVAMPDAPVAWSSADTEVTRVGPSGLLEAAGTGTASVVARSEPARGTAVVTVRAGDAPPPPPPPPPPENSPPTATFTSECGGLDCVFTDRSTDEDGSLASWAWEFGDGARSTERNPSHTYPSSGTYTVTLTVADDDGAEGSRSQGLTVEEPPPPPPPPGAGPDFGAIVRGIRPRGYGAVPYHPVEAASGATTYYVDPAGADGNPGTAQAPFRTIDRAAQVARRGDVVNIRPGTYRESVEVRNAGVTFQATERGGVILTGGEYHFVPAGWTTDPVRTGPIDVTVRGLVFRRYAPESGDDFTRRAAVGAGSGWLIEDCLFDAAGYNGIDLRGDRITVRRSTFENHHTNAITAWAPSGDRARDILVADAVIRRNHTRSDPLAAAVSEMVVKFMRTDGLLVDNVESYENKGPGLWLDNENQNYTIRNSYFHDQYDDPGKRTAKGVYLEVNPGPGLVENNVIRDNDDSGVMIANTRNTTIRNNLMVRNDFCVSFVNVDRGPGRHLADAVVEGNYCKEWTDFSGMHTLGGTYTTPALMGIRLDGNRYDPGSQPNLAWWAELGGATTIPQMRAKFGWEENGRVEPISEP